MGGALDELLIGELEGGAVGVVVVVGISRHVERPVVYVDLDVLGRVTGNARESVRIRVHDGVGEIGGAIAGVGIKAGRVVGV